MFPLCDNVICCPGADVGLKLSIDRVITNLVSVSDMKLQNQVPRTDKGFQTKANK